MITTPDTYIIEDAAKVQYVALNLLSVPTVLDEDDTVNVEIRVLSDAGGVLASELLSFTNAEIAAFTASGTTDRDKFFNQCEQAVVDYLEGFGGNAGVTFTIS